MRIFSFLLLLFSLLACAGETPVDDRKKDTAPDSPAVTGDSVLKPDVKYKLVITEKKWNGDCGIHSRFVFSSALLANDSEKVLLKMPSCVPGCDCNSVDLQIGGYVQNDTMLSLYSFWCHAGDNHSPFGARKRTFRWDAVTGTLTPVDSLMYVDFELYWEDPELGNTFDFYTAQHPSKKLVANMRLKEKEYHAQYATRKTQGDSLLDETRLVIHDVISSETKGWETDEIFRSFGYRK